MTHSKCWPAGGTGEFGQVLSRGKQHGPSEYHPKFGTFLRSNCCFGGENTEPASVNCIDDVKPAEYLLFLLLQLQLAIFLVLATFKIILFFPIIGPHTSKKKGVITPILPLVGAHLVGFFRCLKPPKLAVVFCLWREQFVKLVPSFQQVQLGKVAKVKVLRSWINVKP